MAGYLSVAINRKISPKPGSGLCWDAHWWRHSEVVARLTALWWAFEGRPPPQQRGPDRHVRVVVDHASPTSRSCSDGESGPMSGASRKAHGSATDRSSARRRRKGGLRTIWLTYRGPASRGRRECRATDDQHSPARGLRRALPM
ncbi:DUF4913 domain-containing protein [Rhodococcus hoagii]|nr:DUF4913 domain-containing protein [Prescottella equi]